jgi:hypothetical protein
MIFDEGIQIMELEFPDGSSPPKQVIKQWLKIVKEHFSQKCNSGGTGSTKKNTNQNSFGGGNPSEIIATGGASSSSGSRGATSLKNPNNV